MSTLHSTTENIGVKQTNSATHPYIIKYLKSYSNLGWGFFRCRCGGRYRLLFNFEIVLPCQEGGENIIRLVAEVKLFLRRWRRIFLTARRFELRRGALRRGGQLSDNGLQCRLWFEPTEQGARVWFGGRSSVFSIRTLHLKKTRILTRPRIF